MLILNIFASVPSLPNLRYIKFLKQFSDVISCLYCTKKFLRFLQISFSNLLSHVLSTTEISSKAMKDLGPFPRVAVKYNWKVSASFVPTFWRVIAHLFFVESSALNNGTDLYCMSFCVLSRVILPRESADSSGMKRKKNYLSKLVNSD